jgi:hypothetical protein
MGRNRAGWVLVVLGGALLALSALAEPLGLGDNDGIGWKQTIGMIVGGVVLVAGLAVAYVRRHDAGAPQAGS